MYPSLPISSTRFVLIPILAVVATQLLLMRTVTSLNMTNAYLSHKCLASQGKYKPGSWHDKTLETIIESIGSDDEFRAGFGVMSLSKDSDIVSVNLMCRGDSYGSKCRSCYATAVAGLRRRCPRYKGAIIWYDQCSLEFSSVNNTDPGKIEKDVDFCMSSAKRMNVDSFVEKLMAFLDNLVGISNKNKSSYEAEETRFGTKKLYGMVQLRTDLLTSENVRECVRYIAKKYQDCWNGKQGARVMGRSCNFRFELYPFVGNKSDPRSLKI